MCWMEIPIHEKNQYMIAILLVSSLMSTDKQFVHIPHESKFNNI
jgi:hypothetical protein